MTRYVLKTNNTRTAMIKLGGIEGVRIVGGVGALVVEVHALSIRSVNRTLDGYGELVAQQ
jgi:hypothetical protein